MNSNTSETNSPIYLDYNATTPLDPQVVEAMLPFLTEHFGNPSSGHIYGRVTHAAVEKARGQVAKLIGAQPGEIVFTSGGSESNNHAIRGAAELCKSRGTHLITSDIEHPAVFNVYGYLEKRGYTTSSLPVNPHGCVDSEQVREAIRENTTFISLMHANNEVGSIQPIPEIAKLTREKGILLHSDAAQSLGKIPVNVDDMGVDLLSIAGHKIYAPKGIGALYIREGIRIPNLIFGAAHENGRRAGTENVASIVGMGKACEIISATLNKHAVKMKELRDELQTGLLTALPDLVVNGHPERRLPNTLSISFPGLEANALLNALSGIAASAGAACHSNVVQLSSVLKAMDVPRSIGLGTIRFSIGRFTTREEILQALESIIPTARSMMSGVQPV